MVQTVIARSSTKDLVKKKTVTVDSSIAGTILNLKQYLGTTSTISLVSADTNLSLVGIDLKAINNIADGVIQTAMVRESLGLTSIEYPLEIVGKAVTTPAPTPTPISKLKARPAPPEPEAYIFNSGQPGVNSESKLVPTTDYDIDLTVTTDGAWKIFIGADADFQNGLTVETRNVGHFGIRYLRNGESIPSYADYVGFTQPDVAYPIRLRRKGSNVRIFVIDMDTPVISFNDTTGLTDDNRFVKVINFYDQRNTFTYMQVKPTSLVTDRIILSDIMLESATGKLTATIDYYLSVDGYLTGSVKSIAGDVVIPAENYRILDNAVAGRAKVELLSRVPSSKKGSRIRIETKAVSEPTLIDNAEITFPQPTEFGQNVAGLGDCRRPIRTYTNMMMQGYWQNTGGQGEGYNSYDRSSTAHLDAKGWPKRGGLWFWYPLPDERNQEVTYVLKWTGGDIDLRHFANTRDNGVVSISGPVRVDANTYEWKMVADRTIGVHDINGRFEIASIDVNNTPKNMTLCLKGEDLSQRFKQTFIDFLKLLPGYLRFMDDRGVNGEKYYYNTVWDWSKRTVQDNGSMGGLAMEDMIELCNRSNRPLCYNIHASYAFNTGGMDYYRNEIDLLYGKVQGLYTTPGFSAPTGMIKTVYPEVGNENWNPGFGGMGTYHYLADKGYELGLATGDNNSGGGRHGNMLITRNLVQTKLMAELETRITDWRARTVRVMGLQMTDSDFINVTNAGETWDDASKHVDTMLFAPYVPGDPNAGGSAANYSDRSPAGVCAFLKSVADNETAPLLNSLAAKVLNAGYAFGIYEINVAMISLGLTFAQIVALTRSDDFYNLWKNTLIPMCVANGGQIAIYSDVGPVTTGEMWSLMHVLGTDWNRGWDAIVDWSKSQTNPLVAVGTPQALYSDTFDGDGPLNTRANWSVPVDDENKWGTTSGGLYYTKQFGPSSVVTFGGETTGDQYVDIEYDVRAGGTGSNWDPERTEYIVFYKDASNFVKVIIPAGAGEVQLYALVNGTYGPGFRFYRPAESSAGFFGTVRILLSNGYMRVAWNGTWTKSVSGRYDFPLDRVSLAELNAPSITGGKFGINASTWTYLRANSVSIYKNLLSLESDDEFVGRDSTSINGGTWTCVGSYSGNPTNWAVRVLDADTGAVIIDWAAPKSIVSNNGQFTATVFLPTGKVYTVELSCLGSDNKTYMIRSRPCQSGYHVVYYGQSNSLGRSNIYDGADRGKMYAGFVNESSGQANPFPAGHWSSTWTSYRGIPGMGMAKTASALLGIPVAVTAAGVNGTPLNYLTPGEGGWNTFLNQISTLKGIIELVIWDQGEGDADGTQASSDYVSIFRDKLVPALRARAGNPNMKILISPVGNFPGGSTPNPYVASMTQFNAQRETIKQAHQTLVDTVPGVEFASFKLGSDHGNDSYHYTPQAYFGTMGQRDGFTVAKTLGAVTHDGLGPKVTAASTNGVVITLTIDKNGSNTLNGPVDKNTYIGDFGSSPVNSYKGYEVSADNFATNLPITNIAVSGDTLVITLASAPSGPVKIRSFSGANYDDRSLFMGSYTDGATIPVAPIIKPLSA